MEENYVKVQPRFSEDQERVRKVLDTEHDASDKDGNALKIEPMMLTFHQRYVLGELFSYAQYWRRAWVVQELSCAPCMILLCEGEELNWQLVSTFLRNQPYADAFHYSYSHGSGVSKLVQDTFRWALQAEHQRWILQNSFRPNTTYDVQKSTLLDVLARFREKKSSDPRDKVYALLGLVSKDHGIIVDYSKSMEELFQEVTMSIINRSRNLDIICQNPFEPSNPSGLVDPLLGPPSVSSFSDSSDSAGSLEPNQDYLPTWVADLRVSEVDVLFAQRNIFNAGKTSCEMPRHLTGRGDKSLILRGCIIGRIGTILHSEYSTATIREIMLMYLGRHVLEESQLPPYNSIPAQAQHGEDRPTESVVRAYWRTLLKDCTKPPGMRRLTKTEIDSLGVMHEETLTSKERKTRSLYSYKSSVQSKAAPSSTASTESFPYLDEDGELATYEGSQTDTMFGTMDPEQGKGLEERHRESDFMFVMSNNGLFVMARRHAREGDAIVVLDGGKVPMLLREIPKTGVKGRGGGGRVFQVVGPAYVHGWMDGLAEIGVGEGWLSKEDIALV